MKNFEQWIDERLDEAKNNRGSEPFALDAAGGIIPTDLKKAKKLDLITLPESVKGTNCGNCRWVKMENGAGFCQHREVKTWVNDRMCCVKWDHSEVRRPWENPR